MMDSSKPGYYPVFSNTLIVNSDLDSGQTTHPTRSFDRHSSRPAVLRTLGYASVAVVPVALAIWLSRSTLNLGHSDIFRSSPLGGSLTFNQAKAIDFVSSAVLAPLIFAIFNYIWFTNARVSVADERQPRADGTSLFALVQASTTSTGSYDLVKLWTFCTSRSIRLAMFAILTLATAVGYSTLSNIIAYEAFKRSVPAPPASLRLLTGPYLSSFGKDQSTNNVSWLATHDQRKDFAQGTSEVLLGIAWQNSTPMLTSGAYVTLNVTTFGLTQLDSSVIALHNVPAINATIECQAHTPENVQIKLWNQTNGDGFSILFDAWNSATNTTYLQRGWTADVPGTLGVFQDSDALTSSLDFLAYNNGGGETSMFIGSVGGVIGEAALDWSIQSSQPLPSPFGPIQARPFQIGENGVCAGQSNNCTMLVWGITCAVHQRQGVVNYTRASVSDPWNMSSKLWDLETKVRPSRLRSLARDLGTQTFKSMKAGLAPALTPAAETCNSTALQDVNDEACLLPGPQHLNYQTLADNLLWAEMAVQTVAYETGAMNASLATPDMFIMVSSVASVQRYRMTYIPSLLLGGLICIFVAAILSTSLLAFTTNTTGGRQYHSVDSLQLLVDCLTSLREEDIPYDLRFWPRQELDNWAKNLMVRYDKYDGGLEDDARSSTVHLTAKPKTVCVS